MPFFDINLKELPTNPGCYIMKDHDGVIFYIGKANNLRQRIRSYFNGSDEREFVGWLGEILADIETIIVNNNTEALLLEQALVRKHQPRFNVLLKDDKNYIMLRLDTKHYPETAKNHQRYPRLEIVRKRKNDGAKYFGPYPSANQLRTTVRLINKYFKLRTCNDKTVNNRARPCIQYQMNRCPGPCVMDVPYYRDEMTNVIDFLSGRGAQLEQRLQEKMWELVEKEDFEQAAQIRDQLKAIETSLTRQVVSNAKSSSNQDVIAACRKGPLLEIVRLTVREGHTTGSKHYPFDHQEFPTEELLSSFLLQLYEQIEQDELPREILTSHDLGTDGEELAKILTKKLSKKVEVLNPSRGNKRALVLLAEKNAALAVDDRLKTKETKQDSLERLKLVLGLGKKPKTIECFDVSLIQGTDPVASRVSFKDGEPDKSQYRLYNIKTVHGMDDFAMLFETLSRRLKSGLENNDLPNLLLVDGGKGQLSVALAACHDLKIDIVPGKFFVAGIAKARVKASRNINDADDLFKTEERLFLPNVKDPISLKQHSPERYLIERIRDEAHRFAITAHRKKRTKRVFNSKLDTIDGISKARKQTLLLHFGSLKAIQDATVDEIMEVPGIGKALATEIHSALGPNKL